MDDSPAPNYVSVNISSGIFGTMIDVCQRCGVALPVGRTGSPEEQTPRWAHDRFHERIAEALMLVAKRVDEHEAHLQRQADYDEEMQERADG